MSQRREFLTASLAAIAASCFTAREASAQSSTPESGVPSSAREASDSPPRAAVQWDAPAVDLEGWQIAVLEIRYPPGRVASAHRHPGFVVGYVLQGQYRFAVNDDSPTVLSAGETFFESPGDVHSVSANPSETEECLLLAILFTPKGEPVAMPV